MQKIYFAVLFFLIAGNLTAQRHQIISEAGNRKIFNNPTGLNFIQAIGCDTVNFPIPVSWTAVYYEAGPGGSDGFVTGNNVYGDLEKAAYFDVSASSNTFLTKVWMAFGIANSNNSSNLTKIIPIKIYDGTSGQPGTLLATSNKLLSELQTDIISSSYSEIIFPTAVILPASKKFFVSVDISNLTWSASDGYDSLAIYSNQINQAIAGENGFGWEKNNTVWSTFNAGWGIDLSLIIHPFISTNSTCSINLPVRLKAFYGEHFKTHNELNWSTATEQHNKGFEIQKSVDGLTYNTFGFINSKTVTGNSTTIINYHFSDMKPFAVNNYYRLKQIDKNGGYTISNTILLKGSIPDRFQLNSIYPNPANNLITISLSVPAEDKANFVITDFAGRIVLQNVLQLVGGINNVKLNVSSLKSGTYLIKIIFVNKGGSAVGKFVKQ